MSKSSATSTANFPDEMPNMDKEEVFFDKWLDKISTKRKKNRRRLVITDWEFFVLKKKSFSKKLILSYTFKWLDITSIESSDEYPNQFTLFFKNDKNNNKRGQVIQKEDAKVRSYFIFKYPKCRKLLGFFYTKLKSFQMDDDLPSFKYPPLFSFPNAQLSITDYLRMKQRRNNHRISASTINSIKKFIASKPTEFCLTEIRGIVSILPLFLEIIYLIPTIKTLIIPFNVNFNSLKILMNFLPENKTITSLTFKDKLPENFSKFTETFLSSSSSKIIHSFKFINSKFSMQDVKDLSKVVRKRNIMSLHLNNVFCPISIPPFKYYFQNNSGFQNLNELSIDHAYLIEIRSFMPYLKNVSSLSLTQCSFQIADLFAVLTPDYQMTYLNVSQNKNEKRIFDPITFPRFLSVLILQNIEWDELSLREFVESLMNHKPEASSPSVPDNELKLDLSHLGMNDKDWELFFGQLEDIPRGNIVGLKWDNNPIDKRFIMFINSFINLRTLSLNGCFIRNDSDLNALLQFIAKSKLLENLSFTGTDIKSMGRQVLSVIDTLYVNRSIKCIDVSNHNCGDSILVKLCDVLIENRVIEEISFNRNGITDINLFEMLLFAMQKRGKPLFFQFPKSFAKSMLQFGNISNDDVNLMQKMYQVMVLGNPKIKKIPEASIKRKEKVEDNESENENEKEVEFVMKDYENDIDNIDYDENAKNRRLELEKKFEQMKSKFAQGEFDDIQITVDPEEHKEEEENDEFDFNEDDEIEITSTVKRKKKSGKKKKKSKGKKKSKANEKKKNGNKEEEEDGLNDENSDQTNLNNSESSELSAFVFEAKKETKQEQQNSENIENNEDIENNDDIENIDHVENIDDIDDNNVDNNNDDDAFGGEKKDADNEPLEEEVKKKSSKAKHKKKHKKKGSKSKSKKKGGGDNPLDVMSGDDLKDGDLIISSENEIDNIDDNKDDIEIKSESD